MIENRILQLARFLATKDGIVLTGGFSSDRRHPECTIENLIKKQPISNRRKIKRKYRKIKRFVKRKKGSSIFVFSAMPLSLTVKDHYIERATKILRRK